MSYAFVFDASACSGCKACQEACKDKNCLPLGVLWRRVIEVGGGDWQPVGEAWENSVFAYNVSLACNHCTHPKCAGVCPTDAYIVRADGIVLLDTAKCMGCGYCDWACPYGAPQLDRTQGVMTKCDFCYDNIDDGLPPSCVAACPLRVLEYSSIEELSQTTKHKNLWQLPGSEHPYPLPTYSRTEPHLSVMLHQAMSHPHVKQIGNREEIHPPGSVEFKPGIAARRELPLVAFTLLTQMAAGMSLCSLVLHPLPLLPLLTIGLLLGIGGLASFLHLGRKRNAWRSIIHLRKSWLSREILMAGLLGAAWAATAGRQWLTKTAPSYWPMAIFGVGLVYAMSRVYRLRAVPGWNTWRTQVSFFLSAIVLGSLGIRLFSPQPIWNLISGVALAVELVLALATKPTLSRVTGSLRQLFLGLAFLGAIFSTIFPGFSGEWMAALIFSLALAEEIMGRWLFYAMRTPFPMQS